MQQFTAFKTKEKIRIKRFSLYLAKDATVAKVSIGKLNRAKDNLPRKAYVCSDHFANDCFDSFWMPQFTLIYSDRPIQTRYHPRAIPAKFQHKLVKK